MNIIVKVNLLANLYFFISTLSCWHKSCRLAYSKDWLKNNPLTSLEKEALTDFANIHQKYSFNEGSYYLGRAFFLYDDPWEEIREKTEFYNRLKQIFDLFEPRFMVIWESNLYTLNQHRSTIENFFFNNREIKSAINKHLLNFFVLDKPLVKSAWVILLLSSDNIIGGGANLKPHGVTLEVSGWHKENKKLISVLYHELIHLCYENYKMLPEYWDGINSSIREVIIAGLFPNGYLANKYLQINNTNKFSHILKYYIENSKQLDSELIDLIKKQIVI